MRVFGRRKKAALTAVQAKRAEKLGGWIVLRQRELALWLNRRTASWTVRHWKYVLLGFCLLVGSYCLLLILSAIY